MIFGIIFLGLQTALAFYKPRFFLFSYLLFISSFLGLLPREILIGDNEIGLFYQSFLMLLNYIFYYRRTQSLPSHIKLILKILLLFYLYGVLYPVLSSSSSIVHSVIASKEFSTLFLIHYLFIHKNRLSITFLNKVINFFGYFFLLILLSFVLLDFIPPAYIKTQGYLEFKYPAILSLFIFLKAAAANSAGKKRNVIVFIIVWTVGMYFEGHTAILLTTTLGSLFILFNIPVINFLTNFKKFLIGSGIATALIYFFLFDLFIEKILETPSFKARSTYNNERLEMINENLLQGYGFLHKSASKLDGSNVYMESLSFIDSGYIDLLGKFGIIGMVIFLFALTSYFFKFQQNIFHISLKLFFVQYFFINITWSVFSYALGTIALSLAMIIIYKYSEESLEFNFSGIKNY